MDDVVSTVVGRACCNINEALAATLDGAAEKTYLCQGDRSLTFGETDEAVRKLTSVLQSVGVVKGDRVCVLMPNSPDHVLTLLAAARAGAVQVPLNAEYSVEALVRLIRMTEPRAIFLDAGICEEASAIIAELGDSCPPIFWTGRRPDDVALGSSLPGVLVDAPSEPEPVKIDRDDLLMLIMTSGTTGAAKAVSVSHGYALHLAAEVAFHLEYTRDDVLYTPYPLFHGDAPLLTVMPGLMVGCQVAIGPKFSASRFWDDIRHYGATVFGFMGAVLAILDKQPPRPDDQDNSVRIAWGGPAPANWKNIEKRFDLKIREAYGATECCIPVWESPGRDRRDGTCGMVCEHHEVMILGPDGTPAAPGEVGEILVRSKLLHGQMSGYFGNVGATAEAWRQLWYHSGDQGSFDKDGYFRFVGRKRDVIRRRGRNISAVEIESVVLRCAGVVDAAAIAVPSELTEDDVKLVVEGDASAHEILGFAAERLPRYMVPRYIEVVESLPRTPTGKVDKTALRSEWRSSEMADTESARFGTLSR